MQVLPPNPLSGHISGSQPSGGSALPANPLSAHLGATAAPVASQKVTAPSVPPALEQYATKIVNSETQDPAFVQHLQTLAKADPTFQNRLNAEVKRLTDLHEAKVNSSPLGITGNVINQAVNPLEWVKGAVEGGPQVYHGAGKAVHGNVSGGAKEAGLGALGVAGVIPGLGRVSEGVRTAIGLERVGRTVEEADAHLAELAAQAKAEGHGGHIGSKGNPPLVAKGIATEETGGKLGQTIREALVRAPDIRKAQEAGYSEERAARFKAAGEASVKAGGGLAGHLAAKRHLADALPKEFFGDWKHLTTNDVDQLARVVDNAPLQLGEKTHVIDSIKNAVENGVVPTKGDQALIERVFGKVGGQEAERAQLQSFWDKFVSYTNIPRALRSSGDVSAAMRQGLMVLVTHPGIWGRQFAKSLKSFGSENFYQAQMDAIHSDPLFPLMQKWKVPFTEIGGQVKNTEEAFIGGQAAEHLHELPGIKGTPVATALKPISNVVRRSDRAFTGFQNGVRFEMAKMLAEKAALLGRDLGDENLGQSIAKVVGTFSGRGVTPKVLEGHLTTLNALMFSPRLMASRLNMLSPVYYAKLDPFARAEALNGARNLVAAIGTVMFVAKMLGAQVNFDPRSSNFTKIKIGNTRLDIAGGYSQEIRLVAQEMTREVISSNGSKTHITYPFSSQVGAKGTTTDLANLTKFARSKAAPIPGMAWDIGSGKDYLGQPIKPGSELGGNAPFISQDVYDAYKQSGSSSVFAAAFLSAIGVGVQSYKDKQPGSTGNQTTGGGEGYWDFGTSSSGGQGYWGTP